MKMPFRLIDPSLPMPEYQTSGSVAFDLYARETTVVQPKSLGFIPTNLIVEIPDGCALLLCSRSSLPRKKHLLIPHGVGIIDQDYRGPKDEMVAQVWNWGNEPMTVERGERVAQALIVRIEKCELVVGEKQAVGENRGGFGSTG
jgi:dUTP pyrophosphatase